MALFVFLTALAGLAACSPAGADGDSGSGAPLKVVATTPIVGDVVRQVGGESIDLAVLLPRGADPHGYQPSPRDIARVADADVVFVNGAGLEEFLQPLLKNAAGDTRVVEVSAGIDLLVGGQGDGEEAQAENAVDPHVWMDPANVITWTSNIEEVLAEMDADHAADYAANAEDYRQQLEQLDDWIRAEVAQVPAGRRKLVVDHLAFAYFADAYGFTQVGAIIPSFSTLAEPSAQELARLEESIQQQGVRAIFVDSAVNPALAERIAADTKIPLVRLHAGSLSQAGEEAGSYLDYMRYNVSAIVSALK